MIARFELEFPGRTGFWPRSFVLRRNRRDRRSHLRVAALGPRRVARRRRSLSRQADAAAGLPAGRGRAGIGARPRRRLRADRVFPRSSRLCAARPRGAGGARAIRHCDWRVSLSRGRDRARNPAGSRSAVGHKGRSSIPNDSGRAGRRPVSVANRASNTGRRNCRSTCASWRDRGRRRRGRNHAKAMLPGRRSGERGLAHHNSAAEISGGASLGATLAADALGATSFYRIGYVEYAVRL